MSPLSTRGALGVGHGWSSAGRRLPQGLVLPRGGLSPTPSPTRMVTSGQAPTPALAQEEHQTVPWPCSWVEWAVLAGGRHSKPSNSPP